jgi:hypothetical protein
VALADSNPSKRRNARAWQRAYVLWLLDRDPEYAAKLIKRFRWKKPKP